MFSQTFEVNDLFVIGLLVVLEGVLSIDNALVLGLLAKRLPHRSQAKALSYGLIGAFVFRLIAVAFASYLLHWDFVKIIGGGYLIYIALKHLLSKKPHDAHLPLDAKGESAKFWSTVWMIELTDIAFAIDSILAAIALVGRAPEGATIHPKLWVVLTGGMLGVALMRVAATIFIKLLEKFPRFEMAAYLLVFVIGMKLLLDWVFHHWGIHLDFQHPDNPAFWVFWVVMAACLGLGFVPPGKK
jgi:YkoY family integral membrane protein